MKNKLLPFKLAFIAILTVVAMTSVNGQINIRIPKINQPKATPTPSNEPERRAPQTPPTPRTTNDRAGGGDFSKPIANDTPVFLKTTLDVRADLENRYWKFPNESNYTSWIPQVRFKVFYSGNTRLRFQAEYFTPDGKSWFTEQLETNMSDGNYQTVDINSSRAGERFKDRATATTGTYGVKITDGRDGSVLFEGKFKVNKYKYGPNIPMFKNQHCFYVEQDWNMPVGYVWLDYRSDQYAPHVKVGMWFKGDRRSGDFEARLFYNGQQIATTDDMGEASNTERRFPNVIEDKELAYWQRWDFSWNKARFLKPGGGMQYPSAKILNKMPGEYTVKVFYQGTQVREASFKVENGNLVDNGIAARNGFKDHKILIPIKILATTEKWNANAWKTDAFYGNPLSGFSIQ